MAAKIFVNYRRSDDPALAGRLSDRLRDAFGQHQVFMDVDTLGATNNFPAVLSQQIKNCEVVLVVIGKNWLDAKDDKGLRLGRPDDFVTMEITLALSLDKLVIPVLADGAPSLNDTVVPADLHPLLKCNAFSLAHERFDDDAKRIIAAITNRPAADAESGSVKAQREQDANFPVMVLEPADSLSNEASNTAERDRDKRARPTANAGVPDTLQDADGEEAQWVTKGPFRVREYVDETSAMTEPKLEVHITRPRADWQRSVTFESDAAGLPVAFWCKDDRSSQDFPEMDDAQGCFIWQSKLLKGMPPQFVHVRMNRYNIHIDNIKPPLEWTDKHQENLFNGLALITFIGVATRIAVLRGSDISDLIGAIVTSVPWLFLTLFFMLVSTGIGDYLKGRFHNYCAAVAVERARRAWQGEGEMDFWLRPWHALENFRVETYQNARASFGLEHPEATIILWWDKERVQDVIRVLTYQYIEKRNSHFDRLGLSRSGLLR